MRGASWAQPSPVELALLRVKGARNTVQGIGPYSVLDPGEVADILGVLVDAVDVVLVSQLKKERGL
tara:strand:- start:7721 stop:7918 length:198 start_codon:yes stop_codon:yes gene_type:complete